MLSGRLAAGYVRGVRSKGVFATVKQFVGNEAEFERCSITSVIDERALRELNLLPFDAGRYDVLIGRSSESISAKCSVEVHTEANGRQS